MPAFQLSSHWIAAVLVPGACLLLACHTAARFADQHTFGPMLGPCSRVMDSVQQARGKPYKRVVGDEEDTRTGEQRFEHEWGYPLDPPVADTVHVVRFRWEEHYRSCRIDERRAKRLRGALLPPWEEAPAD